MRRRDLITGIIGSAVSWPLFAHAQQSTIPLIGFLGSDTPEVCAARLRGFREGLKEAGYIESKNVLIEYRWAKGHHRRSTIIGSP